MHIIIVQDDEDYDDLLMLVAPIQSAIAAQLPRGWKVGTYFVRPNSLLLTHKGDGEGDPLTVAEYRDRDGGIPPHILVQLDEDGVKR